MGSNCLCYFCGDEHVLELDVDTGCRTLGKYCKSLNHTL